MNNKPVTIDRNTKINLGSVVAIIVTMLGAVAWVNAGQQAIMRQVYTLADAERDAYREATANPGHRVPHPTRLDHYIVVELERKK